MSKLPELDIDKLNAAIERITNSWFDALSNDKRREISEGSRSPEINALFEGLYRDWYDVADALITADEYRYAAMASVPMWDRPVEKSIGSRLLFSSARSAIAGELRRMMMVFRRSLAGPNEASVFEEALASMLGQGARGG